MLAVVAATLLAARWLDVAYAPLAQAQSVLPWTAALAALALFGVLPPAGRRRRAALAALCLLVLLGHGAVWLPWLIGADPRPGRELTVMASNLYRGRADLDTVAALVRRRDVDLLVLSEATTAARTAVERHALARLLPHAVPASAGRASTTVIRSNLPLAARADAHLPPAARPRNPTAVVRGGRPITVRGAHPDHPASARTVRRWRATLHGLATWARGTPGPLILAGDLNASVDHPGMRGLLATGLRDAHEVAGAGRPPTWPHGQPFPPFVHIDHVLVRGLDVASAEEVRIPGSDHDAVVARLVVPRR